MATSRRPSSRRAQYESRVEQLDSIGQNKEDFLTGPILGAVRAAIGDFILRVQSNIQAADANVTGSINEMKIVERDGALEVTAPWHLEYMDKGVSGTETKYDTPHAYTDKMPPVAAFVEWIRARNINTVNNEQYSRRPADFEGTVDKEKSIKSAAFLMARKRYRHGKAPTKVYSKELPRLVEDLKKYISDITVESITKNLTKK